jgi:hypothetical protein
VPLSMYQMSNRGLFHQFYAGLPELFLSCHMMRLPRQSLRDEHASQVALILVERYSLDHLLSKQVKRLSLRLLFSDDSLALRHWRYDCRLYFIFTLP